MPCLVLFFLCAQADKRVPARPAARHHPEDVHVQPHTGAAPLHRPHGVYEEERAGESAAAHPNRQNKASQQTNC